MGISPEIQRSRNYGKRYIPEKTGAGFYAAIQDEKLKVEHSFDLNKRNVCGKCNMLKSRNGKCSMGCDE